MRSLLALITALAIMPLLVESNDNGLALKPPLGWRSWNLFGNNVNQPLITSIMDGMVKRTRLVDGKPTSLCDLGYCDVGLDDNWQSCGDKNAAPGMHYHGIDGAPIVNLGRFPSFKNMTDHAHGLGLTSGWYGNNCDCSDHCRSPDECSKQIYMDVAALRKYGFDSWKLDGCGGEKDLVLFNKFINESDPEKPILVENCHWGSVSPAIPDRSKPPAEGCPWNLYRSSGDVRASYASVLHNLGTVAPLHQKNLSYPGCWAYPDMLQVGCAHGPGGAGDPGLSDAETRTHFGSWAIVSSPLTLSHDVNNDTISDKIWPVISNKEVLAVNQAYFGDSGGVFEQSDRMVQLSDAHIDSLLEQHGHLSPAMRSQLGAELVTTPASQLLYKPIGDGKVAVLLMNSDNADAKLTADFSKIPGVSCTSCHVRDIWNHRDLGTFNGSWSGTVESHDAAFLVISA